ncbi:hypothetical protein [Herbiconiux sp. YIM B11900]|uniref:hypothetical protein n=1 Tax=Herbiconiux sp. YIM B11900 TaxID=3404131 RepID=UPI003F87D69B
MTELIEDTDRLEATIALATAHSAAYAQMLVYDEGVGGLGVRHPEMFADMLAWDGSTENDHADTVLWLAGLVARAWDQGMRSGMSRAMRKMSDEPGLSLEIANPYEVSA